SGRARARTHLEVLAPVQHPRREQQHRRHRTHGVHPQHPQARAWRREDVRRADDVLRRAAGRSVAMERELLLEIGCEEIPASWLPGLTNQVGEVLAAQLRERRLGPETPVETYSTPRRLTVRIERIPERQTDFEELITGPPASAPAGAVNGFAQKQGVD